MKRRRAAIMAADVVGYSRLMEANEERTLDVLRAHRRDFFEPTVSRYDGRIFKVMGDGFLVEFEAALGAALCAVETQRGMLERNVGVPLDRQMKFRIGIHLDDVIVDGEDFYGEGVNLAARLEGVARPGGIACSAVVRNQIGDKLELGFIDQGEKAVKNIIRPIHVYFVDVGGGEQSESAARREPTLRDKVSVAILPFTNMSNDPEQEFFSDGITEDVITDLSKVSGLFVLSRNTVFTFKGKANDLVTVARQLGVGHVVEGSVRKAGNRVRISAQLIDGATGGHMWADRYDRDLSDIFAVQDEIAQAVVEQLKVQLLPKEKAAIERAPTSNAEAYTHCLRARQIFHMGTKSALSKARQMFATAVELDPCYAQAYAGMADCDSRLRSKHGGQVSIEEILASIGKALDIDPNLAEAHAARGYALMVANRRAEAGSALQHALTLDPYCHEAHYHYADFCVTTGEFEQAAGHYIRALELKLDDYISPLLLSNVLRSLNLTREVSSYARIGLKRAEEAARLHPENSKPAEMAAGALLALGEPERAIEWLARALAISPEDNGTRYNAACIYSMLGQHDRAIDLLETYLRQIGPDLKLRFLNDSDFDPIRGHSRYKGLLELAGGAAV